MDPTQRSEACTPQSLPDWQRLDWRNSAAKHNSAAGSLRGAAPADGSARSRDTSDMRARLTSSHFVGRVGELAELELALRESASQRPVLVLLGGESGVGKTRLIAE